VNDLSVYAGDGLRWLKVLLVGQADSVRKLGEIALALELVAVVVSGDANFQITQLELSLKRTPSKN